MRTNLAISALLTLLAACGNPGSERSAAPCPEVRGEFPPVACAYVQGRLTRGGVPVAGAGVRVDESVAPIGYAYTSNTTATDAAGGFRLLVFRVNQFEPVTAPDTARVRVKLYPSEAAVRPGAAADDSLLVLMTFAPMGTPVDTTQAELSRP